MNKIKGIKVVPGFSAEPFEVENTLEAKQNAVGGLIQVVYPFDDPVGVVCNDEGKLMGLPANRGLYSEDGQLCDILCGTFLVLGLSCEDFCDLTPEREKKYLEYYKHPERFYLDDEGEVQVVKLDPIKRITTEIWQLRHSEENEDYFFEPLNCLNKNGLSVEKRRYEHVYTFDSDGDLKNIFVRFNIDRPDDFKGHSLSVSDVVVLDGVAHYIDTAGFEEIKDWEQEAVRGGVFYAA